MAQNTPGPGPSPSRVIQRGANQSWYGTEGVSKPASQTPAEALKRDPRKNPVDPKLSSTVTAQKGK